MLYSIHLCTPIGLSYCLIYTVLLYDIGLILFRILTATSLSLTVITVLALQVVTVQVAMPDIDDDENVYSLLTGYRNWKFR